MRILLFGFSVLLFFACSNEKSVAPKPKKIRLEKISYFKYSTDSLSKPFQHRLTYYFSNGRPHRWLELDSAGMVLTDYIYDYDDEWKHIGAKYKENSAKEYSLERVRYENDSTQITEWLDSIGNVYYTMTDNLDRYGKTYRATFKGDKIHGFDSTFYTKEGYEKRTFFTNIRGKIFNDREFKYDLINENGDWISRKKIMKDTITEIHLREINYENTFVTADSLFYQGVLSTAKLSENVISFTTNEDLVFQTRTADWDNQFAFLSYKKDGLFTESIPIKMMDTIYNGAISPSGDKIIYCIKNNGSPQVMLIEKDNNSWSEPKNLSQSSNIKGGYFYWLSESQLYFYIPENGGDIVKGTLENDRLTIVDHLKNLNTSSGTEFSPYVDKASRFIIFTRYVEGDESQQGFFASYNLTNSDAPKWSNPKKLSMLPYGWNAYIINSESQFLFSDGEDILSVPLEKLKLKIKD